MDDVRGDFLGPPHGTTPAAIIANKNKTDQKENIVCTRRLFRAVKRHNTSYSNSKKKVIKLRSFKSSEHINERRDEPYHGFGHLSLFSDPSDLAKWSQREIL